MLTAADFARNLSRELWVRDLHPAQSESAERRYIYWWRAKLTSPGRPPIVCIGRLNGLRSPSEHTNPPSPAEIEALATALNCPVERLTVSREELERRLAAADELANDLVEHLEHERALRRHDREAANALRRSHDEIEVLLEVIEERFPETSDVINAVVAYDRANALRARVAELEAEKAALRCKSCEKPFGERAGSWWRTDEGDLYCPFCEKEEHQ